MTTFSSVTESTDSELVSLSLGGDREAFSQIVLRYQTLVCSLAYSIIGNLGQSEDAAQETFIVAWKRLRHLREPSKLRGWLCGIVHNRARDSVRRDGRQAAIGADSLDVAENIPSAEELPCETAIGNEEQAIMWRALCRVPEIYREPLILYYREHNSVERVAEALELSEDAVKQRLSRGRKLLHQEVIDFVEDALRRTAPDRAFTSSVLNALPLAPALTGAGTLTAMGKSAAAKSTGVLAVISAPLLSVLGVFLGLFAQFLVVKASSRASERRAKAKWFAAIWGFSLTPWVIQPVLRYCGRRFGWDDRTLAFALAAYWGFFAAGLGALVILVFRRVFAMRAQESSPAQRLDGWATGMVLLGGIYGANILWLIALAWQAHDPVTAGIVFVATAALAAWHFRRLRVLGRDCNEGFRLAVQHIAIVWGLILLTLNLRLDRWLAFFHGVDRAQWHQILPAWTVPALTVLLLAWLAAVTAITRPARRLASPVR